MIKFNPYSRNMWGHEGCIGDNGNLLKKVKRLRKVLALYFLRRILKFYIRRNLSQFPITFSRVLVILDQLKEISKVWMVFKWLKRSFHLLIQEVIMLLSLFRSPKIMIPWPLINSWDLYKSMNNIKMKEERKLEQLLQINLLYGNEISQSNLDGRHGKCGTHNYNSFNNEKSQYCNSIEGQNMEQWKMKWEGKVWKILNLMSQ